VSPIEKQFWEAWLSLKTTSKLCPLTPQHPVRINDHLIVAQYFLDFAQVEFSLAIELDGRRNHKSTCDIENDCKRQRALERAGWRVVRFGGREVYKDADRCAYEVECIVLACHRNKQRCA
jgi:very-short-patch-repair endonuclease